MHCCLHHWKRLRYWFVLNFLIAASFIVILGFVEKSIFYKILSSLSLQNSHHKDIFRIIDTKWLCFFLYLFFLNGERLVKYDVLWCLWICVCTIDTLYLLIYVLSLILWCFRFTELLLHLTVKNICSSFNDKKIKMILPNEYQKASNPCWFKII